MYGGVNRREGNGKFAIRRMKPSRNWESMDASGVDLATYARRDDGGDAMNGLGLIRIE